MYTLDEMISAALLMTDAELREARRVLGEIQAAEPSARRAVAANPDLQAVRRLAESGVPVVGQLPEPEAPAPDFGRMTESAQRAELAYRGIPVRDTTSSGRLREGSYATTMGGQPVDVAFTDAETIRDVADLWAIVEGEFKGTDSMESKQLEDIQSSLQSGRPLSGAEFAILKRLLDKYATQLVAFRASPDNASEGFVAAADPATGRIAPTPAREMPLSEASAASGAGALMHGEAEDLPHHEIVATLDAALPADHEDRPAVDRLQRHGAALSAADRDEVAGLAEKHRGLLDGYGADAAPLSEAGGLQALADVGFAAVRGGTAMPQRTAPVGTPADVLRAAGVSVRDGR